MTSPLKVTFGEGWDDVLRKLSDPGPELFEAALRDLLTGAALLGQKVAREGAPKDTMALTRSIQHEVRPTLARVFSPLAHALAMENGRRPGAPMPPPNALVGWIRRKGLNVSPFVLARSIARRGIKGRFFMRAATQAVQRAMPNLLSRAGDAIVRKWEL